MVEFLLGRQNAQEGWPISVGSEHTSTMATGHAVTALSLAAISFQSNDALVRRIQDAQSMALNWLHNAQNKAGDWGVEPDTTEGKKSSTMATCYALRGFYSAGYAESRGVQQAIDCLISNVGRDGGWGNGTGTSSDPANTARVVSTLIQSARYEPGSSLIKAAIGFILSTEPLWKINIESYVVSGAPGQVYFHANTLVDVLECLIRCRYFGKQVENLIQFFLDHQDEIGGFWHLQDRSQVNASISTWTTAEALAVLDYAHEAYGEHLFHGRAWTRAVRWPLAFAVAVLVAIGELVYIVNAPSVVGGWWKKVPESWQQMFIGSVVLGLVVGIVANLISPRMRAWLIKGIHRISLKVTNNEK